MKEVMEVVNLKSARSNSLLVGGSRATSTLSQRLENRMQSFTGKALFITLTYRVDEYKNGLDLYRKQSEERHIRLFIRRLSNYLGQSLTGRWVRKMEFTKGGYPHFHLIIDSPRYIPQRDLNEIWGFGHTWINQAHWKHIKYFCKYLGKDLNLPSWLYLERSRSVKIVAASPCFWGDKSTRKKAPNTPYMKWAVFTPLKESFKPKTVVQTFNGQKTISGSIFEVVSSLVNNGSLLIGTQDEYLSLVTTQNAITNTIKSFNALVSTPPRHAGSPARGGVDPSLDNGLYSAHGTSSVRQGGIQTRYLDWELDFLKETGIFNERISTYA